MTSTLDSIPIQCISYNLLIDTNNKEYPYLNGTGFFVYLPPHDDIFYITAKHCFFSDNNEDIAKLHIPFKFNTITEKADFVIPFLEYLIEAEEEQYESEDFIVFVVDKEKSLEDYEILKQRALPLFEASQINKLLDLLCATNQNIRVYGFPGTNKIINYDECEIILQPRGFYGKIKNNISSENWYGFENVNWKESFHGFSGSPVFALFLQEDQTVIPIIVGILLNATSSKCRILSMKPITELIQQYFIDKSLDFITEL